ncbi:MAG: protein-L-isoaspartate O-methyltransferase [Devosia sp.]
MTDFAQARKAMVDNQLRTSNVTDRRLLAAMGEVPREHFVPASREAIAYIDETHPLHGAPGRFLPAPAPFAKLVQLAEIVHTDHVLDLAAGNGYSTDVLAHLAASVTAVEGDSSLVDAARKTLAGLGIVNASVVAGSLEGGATGKGPFDVIIIEVSIANVPEALFALLKPEGRLVALIAPPGQPAVAHIFAKSGKGIAARAEFNAVLPRLPAAKADEFVF